MIKKFLKSWNHKAVNLIFLLHIPSPRTDNAFLIVLCNLKFINTRHKNSFVVNSVN